MIQCIQCKRPFLEEERIASMSGSIMGDECTDVYYLCPSCQVYTVASWRDNFTGVESLHLSGPVGKLQGDEKVGLIGKCSEPWDKKCRCDAHRLYFRYALD
jgi:hypothetical protein